MKISGSFRIEHSIECCYLPSHLIWLIVFSSDVDYIRLISYVMIDKNQLRVGNWIRTDEGEYGTVKYLDRYIMVGAFSRTRGFSPEQLDPINVTSDILSLAAFEL